MRTSASSTLAPPHSAAGQHASAGCGWPPPDQQARRAGVPGPCLIQQAGPGGWWRAAGGCIAGAGVQPAAISDAEPRAREHAGGVEGTPGEEWKAWEVWGAAPLPATHPPQSCPSQSPPRPPPFPWPTGPSCVHAPHQSAQGRAGQGGEAWGCGAARAGTTLQERQGKGAAGRRLRVCTRVPRWQRCVLGWVYRVPEIVPTCLWRGREGAGGQQRCRCRQQQEHSPVSHLRACFLRHCLVQRACQSKPRETMR